MAVKIQSPVGEFSWINITGAGKASLSGDMRYNANVTLPTDSAKAVEFMALIEDFWEENKPRKIKKAKSLGFKHVLDDNDEPTGYTTFTFWTGIKWQDGNPKKVLTYNAKGNEIALGGKSIGNTSRGRIAGAMDIYESATEAGVSLYLNSIQITKFVEFKESFDEVEDEDGEDFEKVDEDGMSALSEEESSSNTEEETPPEANIRI